MNNAPRPPMVPPTTAYPPGVPAIQPRMTTNPSQAAFTEDDARQFLATHQVFATTDGSIPEIARVLFIPASQASALLTGESIGRPDTTLVCYVEVHGLLSMAHVHRPHGINAPSTAHIGDIVFDAQTGNLLLWGFDG